MFISRCPTSNKLNSIFEVPCLIILSWGIFVNLQLVVYLTSVFVSLWDFFVCECVSAYMCFLWFLLDSFSCLLAFPALPMSLSKWSVR